MAKTIQFDASDRNRNPQCLACEEMLTDALDGTLSEFDQAWFDRHLASCTNCSQSVADARRGAAWLEMLKMPRPEPSAKLVERILAETEGLGLSQSQPQDKTGPLQHLASLPAPFPAQAPLARSGILLPFRPRMPQLPRFAAFEPRLAMTAAMAFFSITLTLNLSGVRLDQLRANDFKPASLKRSYYEANSQVVRYYDSLRVVRVLESRVDDLRQASGSDDRARGGSTSRPESLRDQPKQPDSKPDIEQKAEPNKGMSWRGAPHVRPDPSLSGKNIPVIQRIKENPVYQEGGLA